MANTLSVMTNVLRNVVSKQRIRYKEKGFNLDLAYICDNIIAMGYPADNIESFYRNRIEDVYKFLEENHHDRYKIYNLCLERSYDITKFHGRVAVYPFEDHNPPTIELIQKFCYDVDGWLKLNSLNVAAIHCKAGKGRTGTMICCYLLYSGLQETAEDALACYDEKRTKDRKGVTIPSQRRYVQYFSKLIQSGLPYEKISLQFIEIRFADANLLHSQGTVNCSISVLNETSCVKVQTLQTHTIDFRKSFEIELNNSSLTVTGDIKVELTQKTSRKKIFHFWFNTYFVCDTAVIEDNGECRKLVYTLHKNEIDDAHKDKEHKYFSEDFKVQVVFLPVNIVNENNTSINILQQSGKQIHHESAHDSRATQCNDLVLYQKSSSNSDFNYISDQKSSCSVSACSLSVHKASRFIENEYGQDRTDNVPQNACGVEANNILTTDVASTKVPTERLRKSASIPEFYYQMKLINTTPTTATSTITQDYEVLKNHNQLNSEQVIVNQIQQQHPLKNAPKLCRSNNRKQDGDHLNRNCIHRYAKSSSNSNASSRSSISSRSTSSAAGAIEEDWESGESSAKPLANKALFSSPASNINKNISLNLYKNSCFENQTGSKNDDKKINYYNRNKHEEPVVEDSCSNHVYSLSKLCSPHAEMCLRASQYVENPVDKVSAVSAAQNQASHPLPLSIAYRKNPLFKRKSFNPFSEVTYTCPTAYESETTYSTSSIIGNGSSGLATTSKQKLKIKLKKNKLKLSQKFQWFQNYFRSDPVDFCENFVQQTSAMRRNSTCSIANVSHKLATPPSLDFSPKLCGSPSLVNLNLQRPAADTTVALEVKNIALISSLKSKSPTTNIFTVDNFDFYSSMCDNQLSFNNSPCKSPRSLVDIAMNNSFTKDQHQNSNIEDKTNVPCYRNTVVVSAKPARTYAIGFDVDKSSECPGIRGSFRMKNDSSMTKTSGFDMNDRFKSYYYESEATTSSIFETEAPNHEVSFPFVFPNMEIELNNLKGMDNLPAPLNSSVLPSLSPISEALPSDIKENGRARSENVRGTVLNLVIINEANDTIEDYSRSVELIKDGTKAESWSKPAQQIKYVARGGVLISTSTECSGTSEYGTDSSSSASSCNPFALDIERHTVIKPQLPIEKTNENLLYESNSNYFFKSNASYKDLDKDAA